MSEPLPHHPSIPIDVLVGGFPCQDISTAGKGAGLAGGEVRPVFRDGPDRSRATSHRIVVMENVPQRLLVGGFHTVLGDHGRSRV